MLVYIIVFMLGYDIRSIAVFKKTYNSGRLL